MKKIILTIIALVSFAFTNAQVRFSIDNVTIVPGETKELVVYMDNTVDVNGYQFDLLVPEGVTVETKKPGKPEMSERGEDHTITTKLQESGAMRFLVASMDNEVINAGSGAIMTVYITASANAQTGYYTPDVSNIVVSHSGSQKLKLDPFTWNCNITAATSIDYINEEHRYNAIYGINGVRTDNLKHGINIVKTDIGTKKVIK